MVFVLTKAPLVSLNRELNSFAGFTHWCGVLIQIQRPDDSRRVTGGIIAPGQGRRNFSLRAETE